MLKKIAVAGVLFASACIGDGVDGSAGSLPTVESPDPSTTMVSTDSLQRERQPDPEATPEGLCDLLPDDDSACAHACDPDGLFGYIPEGTCATFKCPLADGTTYVTGGCN
jgi:hypothetical protein